MDILKAKLENIIEISAIYENARRLMVVAGNPNQWVNGYPSKDIIVKDTESNILFICVDDNCIVGCFSFSESDDSTYSTIDNGCWLNNKSYSVIHRLAILGYGKGVGSVCLNWCLRQQANIRVDTHEDNASMQALLKKCGFKYCGIIKNTWGDSRLAFQSAVTSVTI